LSGRAAFFRGLTDSFLLVTFSLEKKSHQKVQGKHHRSAGFSLPARGVIHFIISAFGYSQCWDEYFFTA